MTLLGIDIGGNETAVLLGTIRGETWGRVEFPTNPERGFDAFLKQLGEVARDVLGDTKDVTATSIAVGGPLDEKKGLLVGPPHLPGWTNIHITRRVGDLLGLPVHLMHDARACAYAEYRFGAGKTLGVRNMAHLTFATGFGMGAILNGELLDIPGEVGHWRIAWRGLDMFGKKGSLEGFASGAGMEMLAERTHEFEEGIKVETLARLAREGDQVASSILHSGARQCGIQCARLIDQLGLELITLGTIAVQCGDLVMDRIRDAAREEALPHLFEKCRIEPAGLGERLGDLSSLSAAIAACAETESPARRATAGLRTTIASLRGSDEFLDSVDAAARLLVETLENGHLVMTCGNGGSTTDAAHLAEELVGRFRTDRIPLPAMNLAADSSVLTCIANDFGFEEIFARQVTAFGKEGDLLVVFTTSGNSENINRALKKASERGVKTIALTGKNGGEAKTLCNLSVHVPSDSTERIQEIHTLTLHCLCDAADRRFAE